MHISNLFCRKTYRDYVDNSIEGKPSVFSLIGMH